MVKAGPAQLRLLRYRYHRVGRECLQNIADRDEAVFRYVKSEKPWCRAEILCCGRGRVDVMMDGTTVGTAFCRDGKEGDYCWLCTDISCPPGQYTLTLRFRRPEGLRVAEVKLH